MCFSHYLFDLITLLIQPLSKRPEAALRLKHMFCRYMLKTFLKNSILMWSNFKLKANLYHLNCCIQGLANKKIELK